MVAIISIGHAANQTNVYHVSVITLLMQNYGSPNERRANEIHDVGNLVIRTYKHVQVVLRILKSTYTNQFSRTLTPFFELIRIAGTDIQIMCSPPLRAKKAFGRYTY
jgi:hypothetical protein